MLTVNTKTQLTSELKFLIACSQTALSQEDTEFILSYLQEQDSNRDKLIRSANQHGVLPLVYKTLKSILENDAHHIVPNAEHLAFLSDLRSAYMQIAQRNMLMSAELVKIMQLFTEHNIEALSFKGPTLAQKAYGDITLRQFGDLDILIQKKDRHKMMDLLAREHFIPEIELDEKTKETFFNNVNVIGFLDPSTGVRIEVHWELLSKNYAIAWEEKDLWRKEETCMIHQKEIRVLGSEVFMLYLCAHGAKHLFERLEWVCDIDRSVRTNPHIDWSALLHEAEHLGIKRMLFLGLSLSRHFFRLELPQRVADEIQKDKTLSQLISVIIETNFSQAGRKAKSYGSFGLLWRMREKLTDRLRFTSKALFAPKFDDFKSIRLPRQLNFLYPAVRPVRLIMKYFNHS